MKRRSAWDATAPNEGFGKMAGVPSSDNFSYLRRYLLRGKCRKPTTSPSPKHVRRHLESAVAKLKRDIFECAR